MIDWVSNLLRLILPAPLVLANQGRAPATIAAPLGLLVLRGPVGRWRLAGCAVMIAGVVMLGTS